MGRPSYLSFLLKSLQESFAEIKNIHVLVYSEILVQVTSCEIKGGGNTLVDSAAGCDTGFDLPQ